MKKTMITLACIFTVGWVINTIGYMKTENGIMLTLAITFGTFAYHFVMRLLVGGIIQAIYHNQINYRRKWFQPKAWELRLYKKLKVKAWKNRMPTYDADTFSIRFQSFGVF